MNATRSLWGGRSDTVRRRMGAVWAAFFWCSTAAAQPLWTPPAEPPIKPQIPAIDAIDADRNKIDDEIDRVLAQIRTGLGTHPGAAQLAQLNAQLAAPIRIEVVFSRQITQQQIDAFLA